MAITIIDSKNIDIPKWDNCIATAQHKSIYATSIYLNNIAKNWAALVYNNYEIVMPFVYKKKYGITYIYQPAFLPCVGFFSAISIDNAILQLFLQKLLSSFKFIDIVLGYPIQILQTPKLITTKICNNFVLDISKPYTEIYQNYTPHFTKSLRRLQKLALQYKPEQSVTLVLQQYKTLYSKKANTSQAALQNFEQLCNTLQPFKQVIIRKVLDNNNNELLAIVLLLQYGNTLYNLISCTTAKGRKLEANYFLYDCIFKEFAAQNLRLDLEGSDMGGVATFYKKMGAQNEPNVFVHYNNLPAFVKLFKR